MKRQAAQSTKSLLSFFLAPGRKKTYVLGCFARRVTFASQQTRACNLILLLKAAGQIDDKSHVCIVGAGLAGLTAAAMARRVGAKVTLLEQSAGPMSMQLGNFVRFIHPHILLWPQEGTGVETTALPVLNWSATSANGVARQILDEWDEHYSPSVNLIPRCQVVGTEERKKGVWITVEQAGSTRELASDFSLVILAVGFGWEREMKGISFRSYWSNDALHQQFPTKPHRPRVLVSGTGDGGLIDTLRLKLSNFDHASFVTRIYGDSRFEDIRQEIISIEKLIDADERASWIRLTGAYELLLPRIPKIIRENILSAIRQDVDVCLNGTLETPIDPKASSLHRLTIFLIWRSGHLQYESGRIDDLTGQPGRYRVNFAKEGSLWLVREFDECIIRHGANPAIAPLFSVDDLAAMRAHWNDAHEDPTLKPMWPADASGVQPTRPARQLRDQRIRAEQLAESVLDLIGRTKVHSISVEGNELAPNYVVELMFAINDEQLPAMVHGMPVRYLQTKLNGKPPLDPLSLPRSARMGIGAPLRLADPAPYRPPLCSLGCFVHLSNGEVGF